MNIKIYFYYRWINCIAVIEPRKKTVGIAKAWTASQRTVKIGYVLDLLVVMIYFYFC